MALVGGYAACVTLRHRSRLFQHEGLHQHLMLGLLGRSAGKTQMQRHWPPFLVLWRSPEAMRCNMSHEHSLCDVGDLVCGGRCLLCC